VILEGAEAADLRSGAVAGGEFVAYTRRSPDKAAENEDTVAIIPYGPEAAVLVVADGAGGLPAGKRASLTAVNTLIESFNASAERTMLLRNAILNGIEAANAAVQQLGNGSATTLTVVTIEGRVVRAYQVGTLRRWWSVSAAGFACRRQPIRRPGMPFMRASSTSGTRCITRSGIS
jgi:hypothetical protein